MLFKPLLVVCIVLPISALSQALPLVSRPTIPHLDINAKSIPLQFTQDGSYASHVNIQSVALLKQFDYGRGGVTVMAISSNRMTLAVGLSTGEINVYNVSNTAYLRRTHHVQQRGEITSLSFSPQNNSILVAGSRWKMPVEEGRDAILYQTDVKIWDLVDAFELGDREGDWVMMQDGNGKGGNIMFMAEEIYVPSVDAEEMVFDFNPETLTLKIDSKIAPAPYIYTLMAKPSALPTNNLSPSLVDSTSAYFNYEGSLFFYLTDGGSTLNALNMTTRTVEYILAHDSKIRCIQSSPNPYSNLIASTSWDNTVRISSELNGAPDLKLELGILAQPSLAAWSIDSNFLAVASSNGVIRIWDVRSASVVFRLLKLEGVVRTLRWDGGKRGGLVIAVEVVESDNTSIHVYTTGQLDLEVAITGTAISVQPVRLWKGPSTAGATYQLDWSHQIESSYIPYSFSNGSVIVFDFVKNRKWEVVAEEMTVNDRVKFAFGRVDRDGTLFWGHSQSSKVQIWKFI